MGLALVDRIAKMRRRRRLASDERAGVFARRQVLTQRRVWFHRHWRVVAIVVSVAVACAIVAHMLLPVAIASYAASAIVVSSIWLTYVQMLFTSGTFHQQSGVMAEEWTASELRKLRTKGWRLVNHVMLENVDIDHALLGPGGFFAIETKHRTDWTYASGELDKITRDVGRYSARLEPRIGVKGRTVRPLVVMWGPQIRTAFEGPAEINGVTCCPGTSLLGYINSLPHQTTEADVTAAFTKLDRYVKSRDIGEAEAAGPQPKTPSELMHEVLFVAFAFVFTSMPVLLLSNAKPVGVWGATAAAVAIAAALTIRRHRTSSNRVRHITTSVITTAAAIGALLAADLLIRAVK
jgi:Nuclease-related domain